MVQHLQVMDHTGTIGATAYTQPGAILIPWNPDESYARDALLHVQAKLGSPTPDFAIYEHMDVMVHPLGVHLTEKFASQIWVSQPHVSTRISDGHLTQLRTTAVLNLTA